MREIKFRIWDKEHKTWLENGHSLHCFSNWHICPFTGQLTDFVEMIDGDRSDGVYSASHAPSYYLTAKGVVKQPRYVLQQYTGLKDKNGKEIYEGDILKLRSLHYEVLNIDGQFIATCPNYCQYNWPKFENFVREARCSEVVGNLFENKELLN